MASADEAPESDGYQGRRRRRAGLGEWLRNVGTLPILATVMVTAVALTAVVKALDSPSSSSASAPSYGGPMPAGADDGLPTPPHAGATPSPEGTPTPSATPSPSRSASASPSTATTPSAKPSPPAAPYASRHEAETATVSQGVIESNHTGFTGSGFVDYTNVAGSYVQWTVTMPSAGATTLRLRFANGTTDTRPMDIIVNGAVATASGFDGTGGWQQWQTRTITIQLNEGPNTIRAIATSGNGGPNLDHIELAR